MVTGPATTPVEQRAWEVLAGVADPEMPAISIVDLGVVRGITCGNAGLEVTVTPTFAGCPATAEILAATGRTLRAAGLGEVRVVLQPAPPWTSDWITERGRRALAGAGIAPPDRPATAPTGDGSRTVDLDLRPPAPAVCPRCGSRHTVRTSAWGSAACRGLHRCRACGEPFEAVRAV
ncbi:1,2-phenylacetyl-CoA epoxidase subunit PaaD [Nakamurella endophytica]|uniref:Phenylacetic acid degradation protein PaaD n=1 Tax=Nakamurella endophytica TaxID=1748367 RepID=A0A917SNF2_9ACTN|nr:1,2-phenylacetyl-CoA epoxidase subunit PaaD [Nakamurella endophytica]GGL89599.1 phenylacetic acid degradation protein PaaD [Nakamurella endophytica]